MTSGAAGVAASAGAAGACGESGAGGPILQALSTAVVAAVKILSQKRRGEVLVTNKLSLRIFCEDFQRTPAMAGMMLNRVSEQAAAIAARPKQVR